MTTAKNPGSLTIVGTGIKFFAHLTTEARTHIEQADHVYYLLNEPATIQWIKDTNPSTTDLSFLYANVGERKHSYKAISDYLIQQLDNQQNICVALYGHPSVFAQPALTAAKEAENRGISTVILPGISAEDCLFADLKVNPASSGCQSFEATDLLLYQRQIDPSCHVILWQIALTGVTQHTKSPNATMGLELLQHHLLQLYPAKHEVTLYVAAQYPNFAPEINKIGLDQLFKQEINRLATLYIPPAKVKTPCEKTMRELGLI